MHTVSRMEPDAEEGFRRESMQFIQKRWNARHPNIKTRRGSRGRMSPPTYNIVSKPFETPVGAPKLPIVTMNYAAQQAALMGYLNIFEIQRPFRFQKYVKVNSKRRLYKCVLELRNLAKLPITYRIRSCDESKYIILPSMGLIGVKGAVNILICTKPERNLGYSDLMDDSFQVQATTYYFAETMTVKNEVRVLEKLWKYQGTHYFPFVQEEYISQIGPMRKVYMDDSGEPQHPLEVSQPWNERFQILNIYTRGFMNIRLDRIPLGQGDLFLRNMALKNISGLKRKNWESLELSHAMGSFTLLGVSSLLLLCCWILMHYAMEPKRTTTGFSFSVNNVFYFY